MAINVSVDFEELLTIYKGAQLTLGLPLETVLETVGEVPPEESWRVSDGEIIVSVVALWLPRFKEFYLFGQSVYDALLVEKYREELENKVRSELQAYLYPKK